MHIRAFKPEDQKQVIGLWQRCDLIRPWNDPHRDIARKLQVNPELFLVGLVDDRIVATVMGGYEGHRGWINYLAVDPDHQRKGYAREIMTAAERLLRGLGCPKINLQIRSSNAKVIAFYQSIGYRTDDVVSMGKRLVDDAPGGAK